MKKLLWFILLLFGMKTAAQDFAAFERRLFVDSNGDSLPYRVLFPPNYDQSKKYPLVLFLHGAGERGTDNEKQLVHGVHTFLDPAHRRAYPCIVVAPQCPEADYWANVEVDRSQQPFELTVNYQQVLRKPLAQTLQLLGQMIKTEAVDKKRVYITGLSMGGMGTLEALYAAPKRFAAAAVVCGAGQPEAFGKKQAGVPIWFFHGTADPVVGVEHSRAMVDRLQDLGAPVLYTEYEGVQHDSWENAYTEPELLPWLFRQKK